MNGSDRHVWERYAPWVAPLVTGGILVLSTFILFTSHGTVALT